MIRVAAERQSFTLRIRFLSDWRVGTGGGVAGGVDRVVARGPDGLPRIPGHTVRGVLRDSCELVAAGLDAHASVPAWSYRVSRIFGEQPAERRTAGLERPLASLLECHHAVLAEAVAAPLRSSSRTALREALTQVRPGVALDPLTGVALEDHLHFDEVVRLGTVLESRLELEFATTNDEERPRLVALLAAGVAFLDRLGAGRRRGLGRCQATLADADDGPLDPHAVLECLTGDAPPDPGVAEARPSQATLPATPDRPAPVARQPGRPEPAVPLCVDLRLELASDVVVPDRVVGNAVRALHFVPGTDLLQHVTAAIDGLAGEGATWRAIRANELVVTNATPEVGGARGRPVPLCLTRYKDGQGFREDHGVLNAFHDGETDVETARQVKALREGFVGPTPDEAMLPAFTTTRLAVTTRNRVDDDRQRPGLNGVFSYESIAEGVVLRAGVRCFGRLAASLGDREPELCERLSGGVRLGRAKHAGFGAAVVEAAGAESSDREPDGAEVDTCVVWLLSDLLFVDELLRPSVGAVGIVSALEEALRPAAPELRLEVVRGPLGDQAAARARRHDSWSSRWSLPRPTLAAIQAGSCAVLRVSAGRLPSQALAQAGLRGIGQRRAEGYGELCFGDALVAESTAHRRATPTAPADPLPDAGRSSTGSTGDDLLNQLAGRLERAAWRNETARIAPYLADDADRRCAALGLSEVASLSQMQALRAAAARLTEDETAGVAWLDALYRADGKLKRRAEGWQGAWRSGADAGMRAMLSPPGPGSDPLAAPTWQGLIAAAAEASSSLADPATLTLVREPEVIARELWSRATAVLVDACVRADRRARTASGPLAGEQAPPTEEAG